jgi:hypothetical protein
MFSKTNTNDLDTISLAFSAVLRCLTADGLLPTLHF